MAVTAATLTSDFSGFLPAHLAQPIFEKAAQLSVVQRLVPQIPLGINGESIPVVTGRPSAAWIAEGVAKPASSGALALKSMTPKKIGAIMVVSAEVVRANPGNYIVTMKDLLSETLALSFDRAALHDEGPDGTAGGGPFATYIDQATKTEEIGTNNQAAGGIYKDLVDALGKIVSTKDALGRRHKLTGWAIDSVVEPAFRGAVDSTGRPIWVDLPTGADGVPGAQLLNRPATMGDGVATAELTAVVGYGGDFREARWGVVGGINFTVSTEATVTVNGALTSLWENNLVAIRAEAEYGFLVNDVTAFVKLTNVGNVPVTSS